MLWVGAVTALGLLQFTHYYLNVLAEGHSEPFARKLIEEMTAAYDGALCLLPAILVVRRARSAQWSKWRTLGVLAAILPFFSVARTTLNWASRRLLFPLVGLGPYDYGRMPIRFAMEFPSDILFYVFFGGLLFLFGQYGEMRDREVRLARLETELGKARLAALEGQLRPHFLFNVLNTVSAVMYEDVAAADSMLARLGDLLRHTLRRPAGAEIPLAEELSTLDLYLDIMRTRFADRLHVDVQAGEDVRRALVPPLVLQPLVENAVIHGDPGPGVTARIAVEAIRADGQLILSVEDNGPGLKGDPQQAMGGGIGLGATGRRLAQLYGESSGVALTNLKGGGARAVVTLPFRERT
jgi:signal transduction histidine kinase